VASDWLASEHALAIPAPRSATGERGAAEPHPSTVRTHGGPIIETLSAFEDFDQTRSRDARLLTRAAQ
jgi:hypothetical protein